MYRVEPGISDKSFGIHVAELVKFPTRLSIWPRGKLLSFEHINVGGDTDPYVNANGPSVTNEEISVGVEKLKDLLVAWRKECIDPETQGFLK